MGKTFKTEDINRIENLINLGEKIERKDKIYYQNITGTRKSGINFIFSPKELSEYTICANNPIYFIEKYCDIKLYDYQKKIIEHYLNNDFSIFLSSRQVGISTIFAALFLHYITFNLNKKIYLIMYKVMCTVYFMKKIKYLYYKLPFFMKKGIINWNECQIVFEDNSIITRTNDDLKTCDIIFADDYSRLSDEFANNLITYVKKNNIKLIINSQPNGANHFYNLIKNSELPINHPEYNNFNTLRTYWYQVPNRDVDWKKNEIKIIGEELFIQEYDLKFISHNKLYNILY